MLPGPTIIKKCSACSNLIGEHTIASGNTFRARFWTDGKRDAPMLPDHPWLVKCPHCNALLWIDEQETLGEIKPWDRSGTFSNSRACETPSAQDYFSMFEKSISDLGKERYVRLRAWWAGNDDRRSQKTKRPLSDREKANLRRFADLLDEADGHDRVMKVEVLRELGRFDEAMSLMAQPFDDELSQAVSIIRDLIAKKDQFVAEIIVR